MALSLNKPKLDKDREFRTLFAQIESQVATLIAYRKSLIHECVTGQRRITEADCSRIDASKQVSDDTPCVTT